MPKLGTYGSVRGACSNGCLYRDCGLATNHYLRPNPAQRPGYAHAVLGRDHARDWQCSALGDCRRAPHTPKPGRITQSLRLSA